MRMYVCLCARVHICVCACMRVRMCAYMRAGMSAFVNACVRICVCPCMRVCMCACVCACIRVCRHECMCAYIMRECVSAYVRVCRRLKRRCYSNRRAQNRGWDIMNNLLYSSDFLYASSQGYTVQLNRCNTALTYTPTCNAIHMADCFTLRLSTELSLLFYRKH